MRCVLTAALLLAVCPALAGTYKWIDEKGVVNYSNHPPPEATRTGQSVEERVSHYSPDPLLVRDIQRYRQAVETPPARQGPRAVVIGSATPPAFVQPLATEIYDGPYYPRARTSPVFFIPRSVPAVQPRPQTARLRDR